MNPRILVLTLSTFAFGSAAFIFTGMLEHLARDLGVSTSLAGQLQTIYVLTSAFLGPALALLLGKLDRKLVLMIALASGALLNLGCAAAQNFQTLLVLRGLMGMAGGLAFPAAGVAAASLVPPDRRGSAVAMVMGGMTFAFLMGIPLGSVVGAAFGWRSTFVLAAGLAGLAVTGVVVFMPSVMPLPQVKGARLNWKALSPLFMVSYFAFAANMTVNLFIAPVLRVGAGVPGAGVSAFQAMIGVGSILGLALGGRAGDRGAGKSWILAGFGGQILAMSLHFAATRHAVPAGWPSYILVASAIFLAATSLFAVMPVVQSRLIKTSGGAPLAVALNGSLNSVGQATGAAMGGAALAHLGVSGIPATAIGIALTGLVACSLALPLGPAVGPDL